MPVWHVHIDKLASVPFVGQKNLCEHINISNFYSDKVWRFFFFWLSINIGLRALIVQFL